MPRDHVIDYKHIKVTGNNFDDASDMLTSEVKAFLTDCRCHNQFYEPVDNPAGWFNLGKFHMLQALVLRGPK